MKIFNIISWGIFLIGLILKLFQIPGANLLLLLGTFLIILHSLIYFVINMVKDLPSSFLYLSGSFWTFYLFLRVQYIGFSGLIFVFSFLITLVWLILHLVKKKKIKLPQIFLIIYFVFSIFIWFTSAYKIYYVFNYTILHDKKESIYFEKWDKYSWFLYCAHKQDEALEANLIAQKSLIIARNTMSSGEQNDNLKMVQQHRIAIVENNWSDYP